MTIRLARPDELETLQDIEDDAGLRFEAAGMPGDLEGLGLDVLAAGVRDGLLFVLDLDGPQGFALCQAFDDTLHLRELDVVRALQGRGHGRALLDHVRSVARDRGLAGVSLTTFRDVPFNAPFYARYGFREVLPADQPVWLAEIRRHEREAGLDRWPRLAMRIPAS
ncbi:MAG: GNAT family N-acetyltransferase [Myxococcota bacterium]